MWTSWASQCGVASYTAALVEELRRLDVEVENVPAPHDDRDPTRRRETLARLQAADLVHVQHDYASFGGIAPGASALPAYLNELRRPHVITAHVVRSAAEMLHVEQETRWRQRLARRMLASYPPYRRAVETQPFEQARAVIVHTEAARNRLIERGLSATQVHVVPAGIPTAAPVSETALAAFRERFDLQRGRLVSIFGPLTPERGCDLALDALRLLPPVVRLVLAGEASVPEYESRLRQRIRDTGLEQRVTFTGPLEEADHSALLELSDLVLAPHVAPDNSYSVLRLLAHARPIIASDLPEFREITAEAPALELFDPGDETMLAEHIGRLLASPSERNRLSTAAATYARSHAWPDVAKQTRAVYEQALAQP